MRGYLLLALLVAGCGGKATTDDFANDAATGSDTSTKSDGATTVTDSTPTMPDGAPFDFCTALSERATKCGTGPISATECQQQQRCYQTVVRAEDYSPLLTCFATRECGVKDDECVAKQAMKYITDPWTQAYVKACNEKRTACASGFSDDYCGYDHGLLNDDIRAKFKLCLDRSCAEIRDCFNTITAAAGCR